MGKIYCIMGKSSAGKDTIFKEIRERLPELLTVASYTTRPAREGERDGTEYFFVSEDTLDAFSREGKIIELRTYNTVHGQWKYATIDDGQINLDKSGYLILGTLESYKKIREYYGKENVTPFYIEVEDGERLSRSIERERRQEAPSYAEICRRFLADMEDFSEEKLKDAGITRRYYNYDKLQCTEEIVKEIVEDIRRWEPLRT